MQRSAAAIAEQPGTAAWRLAPPPRVQVKTTAGSTRVVDTVEEAALVYQITHTPVLPMYRIYLTQPGDTVASIAQRFHDVAWLVRRRNGGLWNLAPGMRIHVLQWPFGAPYWSIRTERTDHPQSYTIQSGDSLWSIAGKLHTDITTLQDQNGLAAGATIYAGQQIVLHHYTLRQQRVWVPGVPASRLSTGLLLTDMANLVGTDAALVKGLVWNESGWRMVRGASGEFGMVQIMPQTAAWVERALIGYTLDPQVPANNALLGTVLLAYYLDINHQDSHKALALYHSGNTAPNKRNGTYIRAVLGLRAYFYHHPRVGF
jgi:LysM repeat protein